MIAGQIEIQMLADLAQLRQDMDKAVGFVDGAAGKIKSAASTAMNALGAIGMGLSVGAIASWAQAVVDAAGDLNDLSIKTGASVEALSRFQEIGRTSNTSADSLGAAMSRLAKNTALVDDEGKLAAVAIKGLGIDFTVFKNLKPDAQMELLAKKMNEYEDGASKSAIAQALLGKSGADLLPFMKDLASDTGTLNTVTREQAEKADELGDKYTALKARVLGVAGSFVLDLLPALEKMGGLIVPLAITTAAYFGLFVGVPAVFAAAKIAFDAAMLSMSGMGAAAAATTTSLGLLATAGGVLIGLFAGWQLGTWMRENFVEANLAGIAFVNGTLNGWNAVKYAAGVAWAGIESMWGQALAGMGGVLSGFLTKLAGGLSALGLDTAAQKVLGWATSVTTATENTATYSSKLAQLRGEYDRNKSSINNITGAMADEAIQHFAVKRAADENKKSGKALTDQLAAAEAAAKAETEAQKGRKAAMDDNKAAEQRQTAALLELAGLSKDYGEKVKDLNAMLGAGKISHETYYLALDKLQAKTPASIEQAKNLAAAQKLQNDEFDRAFEVMEKERLQIEKRIGAADGYLQQLLQETADLKLTKTELALVTAERKLEKDGVIAGTEAYSAYIAKIKAAVVDKENTTAAISEMKRIEDAAKTTANNIEKGMIDSLFRAFESGKDFFSTLWGGIKNTFKTEILTPIIKDVLSPFAQAWRSIASQISNTVLSPVVNFVTSSLGLSAAGTASAGTSAASGASSLTSLASLGASASAFSSGLGAGFSAIVGEAGLAGGLSAGTTAIGAGNVAGGMGTLIGAAGPYIAAAIAIYAIAKAMEGGETRQGGQYQYGQTPLGDGRTGFLQGPSGGQIQGGQVQNAISGTIGSINALLKDAGSSAQLVGFQAALESSNNGRGGVYAGGTLSNGTAFGELGLGGGRSNYNGTLYETSSATTLDSAAALANFSTDLLQAQIQALQSVTDLPENIAAVVRGIDAETLSAAQASDLIGKVAALIKERKDAEAAAAAAAAAANPPPAGGTTTGTGVGSGADYLSGVSGVQATSMVDSLASIDTKLDAMQKLVDGQAAQSADQRTGHTAIVAVVNKLLQIIDTVTEGGNRLRVTDPSAQPVHTNALVELISIREKLFSVVDSSNRVMTIETP